MPTNTLAWISSHRLGRARGSCIYPSTPLFPQRNDNFGLCYPSILEVVEDFGMQIVGLDYMRADDADANSMHAPVGEVTISSFCDTFRASDSLPVVLLHHNPCGGQYLEKAGIDLYLAGHTHGGQLFPLTLINNRVFQFNKGLYQFGKMQVYTSCGTGTFGPPMRLGTRSELTVLELKPRK